MKILTVKRLSARFLYTVLLCCSFNTPAQDLQPQADYDTLIQRAMEERNQGYMSAAEELLKQAYAAADNKSEAAYLLGLVIAFQERYGESLALIDATLTQYPGDTNLLLAKARVLSFQGLLTEASETSDSVIQNEPDNLDARNLNARIALYQKRPEHAKSMFEDIIANDPNNLEALVGLFDAESAMGQDDRAKLAIEKAQDISPQHVDVLSRLGTQVQTTIPKNSLTLGYERSTTDTRSPNWNDRFIEYRRQYNSNYAQTFRLSHNHRFGMNDTGVETSLAMRQRSASPIEVTLHYTPDADFSAKTSVRASTSLRISEGNDRIGTTVLSPSIQSSRYTTGNINRIGLDLDHYLRNIDAWFTIGFGVVKDENDNRTNGWQVGSHWQYSASTRVGVSYYQGAETENAKTQKSRASAVYLNYRVSPAVDARWDVSRSKRESSYTRTNVSFTLQYRY